MWAPVLLQIAIAYLRYGDLRQKKINLKLRYHDDLAQSDGISLIDAIPTG